LGQNRSAERFGLGIAEITLYTALLSFFTAFIAWGSDQSKQQTANSTAETSGARDYAKLEIPFQPEEAESPNPIPMITAPKRTAPRDTDTTNSSKTK